ncbi:hypothetical protein BAE44_0005278 [Dichanthelium oligosanthes]|uniref:Uncharacterized protein n=1 Tax=Dichanthelium oligosanthes TaxID=888268 RepID=A0A1E5W8N3_9POAL|nr:hypothetical protein BAE44_0005278 [Dichanthelium oligosanthes]
MPLLPPPQPLAPAAAVAVHAGAHGVTVHEEEDEEVPLMDPDEFLDLTDNGRTEKTGTSDLGFSRNDCVDMGWAGAAKLKVTRFAASTWKARKPEAQLIVYIQSNGSMAYHCLFSF